MNKFSISSSSENRISFGLVERLKFQQDTIEGGNFIDRLHSLEDAQPWIDNPETYPKKFRRKTLYLMKTFTRRNGCSRIVALVWCVDEIIPLSCDLF